MQLQLIIEECVIDMGIIPFDISPDEVMVFSCVKGLAYCINGRADARWPLEMITLGRDYVFEGGFDDA